MNEIVVGQLWQYDGGIYRVASMRADDVLLSGPQPTRGTRLVTKAELVAKGELLEEQRKGHAR